MHALFVCAVMVVIYAVMALFSWSVVFGWL